MAATSIILLSQQYAFSMKKILVTGALGQVGSELVSELVEQHGNSAVIATDVRKDEETEFLDVTDYSSITEIIRENSIDTIFHLAAILSALGEKIPDKTFDVNLNGTYNILKASRDLDVRKVIIPSTIGVFGPGTPKKNVPSVTIERPSTMYGITKVGSELLASYFRNTFELDVRGVRYPGLLSYKTLPSAGTTDYAVAMIIEAVAGRPYQCFLSRDTMLPMMYMKDAIDSIIKLSNARRDRLTYALDYNIQAFSFSPEMLEEEIKKHIPDFTVKYVPDYRQKIAETWPESLDVSDAVKDWNFSPEFTFERMVEHMITKIQESTYEKT